MIKQRQLKIAFIVNTFPKVSQTFILNQIVGLIDMGYEVDIFAFNRGDREFGVQKSIAANGLLDKVTYLKKAPKNPIVGLFLGLKIIVQYIFFAPKQLIKCFKLNRSGWSGFLNTLIRLKPFVRRHYSIIHCQFGPAGEKMIFLKNYIDAKVVTSFRGYDITNYICKHPKGVYDELFRWGDTFLPVCHHFEEKLIDLGCRKEKVKLLYSGINMDDHRFKERHFEFQKKIRILSVGRLTEKKGLYYAIKAVIKLNKMHDNIQYTIVGSGEEENALKLLVNTHQLEDKIKFSRFLVGDQLNKEYEGADVFLLPCITAANGDQEGIPNVIKEAMARGLPVLSTRHSGIPELVEDGKTGFLVPERDVDALVEKLEYIITHPEDCRILGREGRKIIEQKFNSKKLNKQLEKLYWETVKQN